MVKFNTFLACGWKLRFGRGENYPEQQVRVMLMLIIIDNCGKLLLNHMYKSFRTSLLSLDRRTIQVSNFSNFQIKIYTSVFPSQCCWTKSIYRELFLRLGLVQSAGQIWPWRCKLMVLWVLNKIFEQATSVYGIRRYRRGAVLYSHLDR